MSARRVGKGGALESLGAQSGGRYLHTLKSELYFIDNEELSSVSEEGIVLIQLLTFRKVILETAYRRGKYRTGHGRLFVL